MFLFNCGFPGERVFCWEEAVFGFFIAGSVCVLFLFERWAFPVPCPVSVCVAVRAEVEFPFCYCAIRCAVRRSTCSARVCLFRAVNRHVGAFEGLAFEASCGFWGEFPPIYFLSRDG